jgi:signal transduction histidine kinase
VTGEEVSVAQEPPAEFFRTVVHHSAVLLAWHGIDGGWHSPALGAIFGVPDGATLPDWLVKLAHPDDQPAATALVRGAAPDEPTELRVRDRDGTWRLLAFTRRDPPGLAGTVYHATDMTGHGTSLTALSGLKAEFIAVVSHELRTPLTTIASLVELLGTDGLPAPDAGAAMATVRRNTERMLDLVDDLNLLADLESGGLRAPVTRVDLADLVRQEARAAQERQPGVSVLVSVPDGPPVDGDRALLARLLQAVLGTVTVLGPAGPVTVAGSVDDLRWRIVVSATASQPGTAERLLTAGPAEPDAHPYRRSAAMSVLLARAIATSHRGGLGIANEPSGRTAATVWLPAL